MNGTSPTAVPHQQLPGAGMGRRVAGVAVAAAWTGLVMLWLSTIWRLHNPFPFSDDYNSCLAFLVDWLETGDISLFVRTYNEAPTLLLKTAVVSSYYLFGAVSFSFLAMLAAMAPVAFSCCLACWVSRALNASPSRGFLLTLPALVLVAQPATWGSYLWATSAFVHGYLPLMALLSFMALERGALGRGVAVAVLAAFFGGAGLFIVAIACAYVVFRWRKKPLVWIVLGLAATGVVVRVGSIAANPLLYKNLSTFLAQDSKLSGMTLYALAFIGNAFDVSSPLVAAVLGAAMVGTSAILALRSRGAALAVIALALCAGISSAVLRFPEGGLSHSLLPRYQVYSTAAWSAAYALAILVLPRLRWGVWSIALVAVGALAYRSYSSVSATVIPFNLKLARELVVARFDPSIVLAEFPPREATDDVLRRVAVHGVYDPDPTDLLLSHVERNVPLPEKSADLAVTVHRYERDDRFVLVRGRIAIQAEQLVAPRVMCLVAVTKDDTASNVRLCLPAVRGRDLQSNQTPPAVADAIDKAVEFALVLPVAALPAPEVDISLMVLGNRNWHFKRLWRLTDIPLGGG